MVQKRRRQVLLATGALLAVSQPALAQRSAKVWRVGFISVGRDRAPYLDEFRKGMRELGYDEGRNVAIESRFADGQFNRLPAQAADLVNREVDVIVVIGTPALGAVKRATSTIPVVTAIVGDPVAGGFVASLARPGGNITGLSLANTDLSAKWLEFARKVSTRPPIGILAHREQATARLYLGTIQSVADQLGVQTTVAYVSAVDDIEEALGTLARDRATAVIVLPSGLLEAHVERIAHVAIKHRIASVGTTLPYAEGGLLLSYGQNYRAFARKAATYVDKIFRGAKPSELPIEQPTILELAINLVTARRLGLTIPPELLLQAERVIE
jgi:putative tryptophan/tyrosine transport system substrate-binding protein